MRKPNSLDNQPAGRPAPSSGGDAAGMGPDIASLFERLPWGVVVLDTHGTVRHLNQQAAAWWGIAPRDLAGKRLGPATAGTLPDGLQQALQQVKGSPEQSPSEFFLPRHQQWITMSSAQQGDDWVVYWQDITAQKQAQHAHDTRQAAANALRRRTEAAARTGSYELELATGRFAFSDGLYQLFGEEPGAFEPTLALIDARSHPDDAATVRELLARAVEHRQPFSYQRRIYRPDGQLRTLECHGRVEADAPGQPAKLLGLLQDVTEREQTAQELLRVKDELARRATDSYAALYGSMDQGFCLIEVLFDEDQRPVDYRFLDVNPAFEQHTGLRGAVGQTIRELVPAIEPLWADTYGRVARTGCPMRFEADVESMDRWFDINAFPIGPASDRHVGVLFTDITARKHSEEALRQSEARYRALFTNMEQGFCLLEKVATGPGEPSDYRHLAVNPAFERHSGLAAAAGRTIRELAPGIAPRIIAIYDEVVASGEARRFEEHLAELDLWIETEAVPEAQSGHLAVLFSNVTARRKAEEVLRKSEARQTYLLALSDALRPVDDAAAVQATVTDMALYYFAADRCYYAEVTGDAATIWQDAARPGLPSVVGEYSLRDMPLFSAVLRDRQPAVVADTETSPAVDDHLKQLCRENFVRAYLIVPVIRRGQLVGLLSLAQVTPRAWTALEVDLLQETAERTWTAVEQARAEAALRQSEEQFRLFVTATSNTVYRMSADWTHLQLLIGKGFLADAPDPTADWLETYIPAEDWPLVQTAISRAIAQKSLFELEHRVRRADGTIGWAHARAIPVLDARGELTGWLGAVSDVSARKQAETDLRESEQRQRVLLENLPGAAVFVVDQALRYQLAEGEALREAGHTSANFLGHTVEDMVSPAHWPAFQDLLQQALAGHPFAYEHEQGGRIFLTRGVPQLGPTGRIDAVLAVSYDITARKQAEEALRHAEEGHRERLEQQVAARTEELRESRNLLQTVFDASPTAIVVMRLLRDAAGQAEDFELLIHNEFNKKVVGLDDLAGQRFTAMFPQTVPTGILARLLQVATTGEPADFEQWYEGEGMRHWFRHIVVWQDGLLVLTSEVITARKLLEQAQAQSLALLQQSEAVAVMGSWSYDLATREFTWSEGLYRLFEHPKDKPINLQGFLDTVLDDDRPAAARLVRMITTGTAGFDITVRVHVGEAVKTVRFKGVPLPDEPGPPVHVLGVCLDVSDVQRLEAENLALKLDHHKELLLAILQAQEDERRRLGEVLHNGLGQVLYATKLRLDQLDTPALHALPALLGLHQQTVGLLAEAMRQNRTLAHELVPTSLLDFGLAAAVADICRDLSTPQLRIACHVWDENQRPLPQPLQAALFRLAQELALNIVRHAGATQATLELETLTSWVSLRAEDNGRGFDPLTVAAGLGLRTVRDAVALLGGTVAIDSSPEFGTHVRLRIPLPLFSSP